MTEHAILGQIQLGLQIRKRPCNGKRESLLNVVVLKSLQIPRQSLHQEVESTSLLKTEGSLVISC